MDKKYNKKTFKNVIKRGKIFLNVSKVITTFNKYKEVMETEKLCR